MTWCNQQAAPLQVPPISAWVIFCGYEYRVGRLESTLAFTTLTLLNVMRFPLIVLPKALRALSGAAPLPARVAPCAMHLLLCPVHITCLVAYTRSPVAQCSVENDCVLSSAGLAAHARCLH
jgi:hypothetical protein